MSWRSLGQGFVVMVEGQYFFVDLVSVFVQRFVCSVIYYALNKECCDLL